MASEVGKAEVRNLERRRLNVTRNVTRDLGAMLTRSMNMLELRASMAPVNSESCLTFIGSNTSRVGIAHQHMGKAVGPKAMSPFLQTKAIASQWATS